MQAHVRRAVGLFLLAVVCLTAWICLIAGCIALIGPALGLGGAFLVIAAVLAATAVLLVIIGRLSASSSPERAKIEAGDARFIKVAASAVMSGLNNKKTLQLALIATSAIAAGVALLLSGKDAQDED